MDQHSSLYYTGQTAFPVSPILYILVALKQKHLGLVTQHAYFLALYPWEQGFKSTLGHFMFGIISSLWVGLSIDSATDSSYYKH